VLFGVLSNPIEDLSFAIVIEGEMLSAVSELGQLAYYGVILRYPSRMRSVTIRIRVIDNPVLLSVWNTTLCEAWQDDLQWECGRSGYFTRHC
jgi:hypothetical protein